MENCDIKNCHVAGAGSGVYGLLVRDAVVVRNSSFSGNVADGGAVLHLVSTRLVTMEHSSFQDNTAGSSVSVLKLVGSQALGASTAVVRNCSFLSNRAPDAAILVCGNTTATFEHSSLEGNTASDADCSKPGGAVALRDGAQATLLNCALRFNEACGGAALAVQGSSAELVGCDLRENRATVSGGALIALGGSRISLQDCRLERNSAALNGGALFADSDCQLDVGEATVFADNVATEGGGGACYFELVASNSGVATLALLRGTSSDGGGNEAQVGPLFLFILYIYIFSLEGSTLVIPSHYDLLGAGRPLRGHFAPRAARGRIGHRRLHALSGASISRAFGGRLRPSSGPQLNAFDRGLSVWQANLVVISGFLP